jgi:hypothetical protein
MTDAVATPDLIPPAANPSDAAPSDVPPVQPPAVPTVEDAPPPDRRRRYLLLLLLFGLLALAIAFAIWYFIFRQPIENIIPNLDFSKPPAYVNSTYGLQKPLGVAVSSDGDAVSANDSVDLAINVQTYLDIAITATTRDQVFFVGVPKDMNLTVSTGGRAVTGAHAKVASHLPQLEIVVAGAPQRQRHDRHVVDRAGLDERHRGAGRNQVEIRRELLVESNERGFFLFAHPEADDDHGHPGVRRGVDVLHAGDLPDQLFHRARDALLDFRGARARQFHEDVNHRNDDLRFFLAWQRDDGEGTQRDRPDDDEWRELGVDEGGGEPAGSAERAHRVASRRARMSAAGRLAVVTRTR